MQRHRDALFIQEGACNPSGIAIAIVEACREIRGLPEYNGTVMITQDAAIRLMVHQLAFICNTVLLDNSFELYEMALNECRELAKDPAEAA